MYTILSILPVVNRSIWQRLLTLLALLSVQLLGVCSAQDKAVTIAFGMDREPYLFPKGTEQGLEIDIVKNALKIKGYQVRVKQFPQLALKTILNDNKEIEGAAGAQLDSTSGVFYSDVYINYEHYVISRREDHLSIDTLDDLKGKKIAIFSDGYNQLGKPFFSLFNPSVRAGHTPEFYEINNQRVQLNMFLNRDVDVIIIDKTVFNWYKKLRGQGLLSDDDFVFHDILPQVTGYNVAFRDRFLRDQFNAGLHQLIQSGRYQQMINYYLTSKGVTIARQLSKSSSGGNSTDLTSDEKRWLRLNPIVTFTGDPDWLPFEGFDEAGEYVGMVAEHLKLLEQKLGIYFSKVRPPTWAGALQLALEGKVDVISGGLANSLLYEGYTPVHSFIQNPVVVVKTTKDDFVSSLDDIRRDTIALVHNVSFNQEIRNRYPNHQFVDVASQREGLEGVSSGKYDAMLGTMAPVNFNIGEMGLYNLRIVGKTELDIEVTLFVTKDKPVLADILNKMLQRITASEYQQINSRWIRQRYVEKTDYMLIASIVVIALLIVAIFLYWNKRLREEVQLRIATEAALKVAKERAEQATAAKSSFLSNMSHEIRTPMNAIMGFTELLSEQVHEKQQRSFIKTIQTAGNNLLTLINDILDLSKIEAGKLDIHKVATNPHHLFDEVARLFMVELNKKQLELKFAIDRQIPSSLMLDTVRLRQILFNLMGNAVKFTDEGRITLSADAKFHQGNSHLLDLVISIEDTGVGIAPEDLSHVFGTFEQAKQQDNQKYGGTGLGLAISLRLAHLMNGDITVQSELGKGTRFELILKEVEVSSHAAQEHEQEKQVLAQSVDFEPSVVLVVDDVEINRLLVKECLSSTRLSLLFAASGPEALALLSQYQVDLILMDIRMPGMDGYEASQQAKALSQAPIVALTATVIDTLDESFIDSAFDDYLKKPVFKKELFSTLKRYLPYQSTLAAEPTPIKPLTVKLGKIDKQQGLRILAILNDDLLVQWQAIRASNRVSDIKRFAQTIEQLGEQFAIDACKEYAAGLNETVNAYDIVGIKNAVKNFPVLSGMIKRQVEKITAQD